MEDSPAQSDGKPYRLTETETGRKNHVWFRSMVGSPTAQMETSFAYP